MSTAARVGSDQAGSDGPGRVARVASVARHRMRLRGLVMHLGPAMVVAASAGLATVLIDRWMGLGVPGWIIAVAPVAAVAIYATVRAWRESPSLLEAAAEVDQRGDLRDRLSTAMSVRDLANPFAEMARADGEQVAATVDARRAVAIRLGRSWRIWPGIVAAGVAAWMWLPSWNGLPARQQQVVQQRMERSRDAAARLKQAITQVRESLPDVTPASAEQLRRLEDLHRELDGAGDRPLVAPGADSLGSTAQRAPEDALADGGRALEKLAEQQAAIAEATRDADEELKQSLGGISPERGEESALSEALRRGDLEEARRAVMDMARQADQVGGKTEAERQRAAQELQRLADDLERVAEETERAKRASHTGVGDEPAAGSTVPVREGGADQAASTPGASSARGERAAGAEATPQPEVPGTQASDASIGAEGERTAESKQADQAADRPPSPTRELSQRLREAAEELKGTSGTESSREREESSRRSLGEGRSTGAAENSSPASGSEGAGREAKNSQPTPNRETGAKPEVGTQKERAASGDRNATGEKGSTPQGSVPPERASTEGSQAGERGTGDERATRMPDGERGASTPSAVSSNATPRPPDARDSSAAPKESGGGDGRSSPTPSGPSQAGATEKPVDTLGSSARSGGEGQSEQNATTPDAAKAAGATSPSSPTSVGKSAGIEPQGSQPPQSNKPSEPSKGGAAGTGASPAGASSSGDGKLDSPKPMKGAKEGAQAAPSGPEDRQGQAADSRGAKSSDGPTDGGGDSKVSSSETERRKPDGRQTPGTRTAGKADTPANSAEGSQSSPPAEPGHTSQTGAKPLGNEKQPGDEGSGKFGGDSAAKDTTVPATKSSPDAERADQPNRSESRSGEGTRPQGLPRSPGDQHQQSDAASPGMSEATRKRNSVADRRVASQTEAARRPGGADPQQALDERVPPPQSGSKNDVAPRKEPRSESAKNAIAPGERGQTSRESSEAPPTRPDATDQASPSPAPTVNPEELPSGSAMRRLAEQLSKLSRSSQDASQRQQNAERLMEQARKLYDNASPEQRERMRQWAQDQASRTIAADRSEKGAPPSSQSSAEGGMRGGGAPRSEGAADGDSRAASKEGIRTEPMDARGARSSQATDDAGERPRVIAEWLGDGDRRADPNRAMTIDQQLQQAAKGAEQAIGDRTVPRRYDRVLQEYFRRLPGKVKAAAAAKDAATTSAPAPADDADVRPASTP